MRTSTQRTSTKQESHENTPAEGYDDKTAAAILSAINDIETTCIDKDESLTEDHTRRWKIISAVLENLDIGFSNLSTCQDSMIKIEALSSIASRSDAGHSSNSRGYFQFNVWFKSGFVQHLDTIVGAVLSADEVSYNSIKADVTKLLKDIEAHMG